MRSMFDTQRILRAEQALVGLIHYSTNHRRGDRYPILNEPSENHASGQLGDTINFRYSTMLRGALVEEGGGALVETIDTQ